MTAAAYREQLKALLPTGQIWLVPREGTFDNLLDAWSVLLADLDARGDDLQAEFFPSSCSELLPDFERVFGLPDSCAPVGPQTIDERRATLLARMTAVGGQSRVYFLSIAAAFGLAITIEEHSPFIVGLHGCGDPVGGTSWRAVWYVHIPGTPTDEQLALLWCSFSRAKPAHTVLRFRYGVNQFYPPIPPIDHGVGVLHEGVITYGA